VIVAARPASARSRARSLGASRRSSRWWSRNCSHANESSPLAIWGYLETILGVAKEQAAKNSVCGVGPVAEAAILRSRASAAALDHIAGGEEIQTARRAIAPPGSSTA
jgi:hypothetical protein